MEYLCACVLSLVQVVATTVCTCVVCVRAQLRRVEVYAVHLTELSVHLTSEHSDYRRLTNAVLRAKQVATSYTPFTR